MTPAAARARRAAILLAPLAVAGAFGLARLAGWLAPVGAAESAERARATVAWFGEALDAAAGDAARALRDWPRAAGPPAAHGLASRLEGLALLDPDGRFLEWTGTPPEADLADRRPGPAWEVRAEGAATRLVLRSAADPDGRSLLASYLVDAPRDRDRFERLLPPALLDGVAVDVEFGAARRESPPDDGAVPLTAPGGERLGELRLRPADPTVRTRRARAIGAGAALGALLLALGLAFEWSSVVLHPGGLAAALAVIWGGRVGLAALGFPALVLPDEIASAALFGSPGPWRLAATPVDLGLSAAAVLASAAALRRAAGALGIGRPLAGALVGSAAAAGAATVLGGSLALLARDASIPVLDPGPADPRLAWALLLAAPAMLLVATADSLVAVGALFRPAPRAGGGRRRGLAVAAVAAALAFPAGILLERRGDQIALERLRSEYLPLVVEQRARRETALAGALRQARQELEARGGPAAGAAADVEAFRLWAGSDLFYGGFKSSLDLVGVDGRELGRFGFDVPELEERLEPARYTGDRPLVIDETTEAVPGLPPRLLHAALAFVIDGRVSGAVVGHVVDDPGNLPFLPGVRPFLAALGPGAPYPGGGQLRDGPQYVLWDASGTVLLSTLRRPPAMAEALVQAFTGDGSVRLESGDERWVGVATQDDDHRLHVLLVPASEATSRAAAALRLALAAAGLVALLALAPSLLRPSELARVLRSPRTAFHRKLLAALLLASIVPLLALGLLLRAGIADRAKESAVDSAVQLAGAAQRVLQEFVATGSDGRQADAPAFDDRSLDWLREVLGQEIHVYENGRLQASSARELFASGLLTSRLDGTVHRRLGRDGLPFLVRDQRLGDARIPVAYAPIEGPDPLREFVVAVPLLAPQREIERNVRGMLELMLLGTVALGALLAAAAVIVARTVARPVRELVAATARIASGDYATRLEPRTRDEVAELVRGFNSMAASLAAQRADLERRREYMERLLGHATTGVLSLDPAGRIVTLNPAARRLLASEAEPPRVGEALGPALARAAALAPLARALALGAAQSGDAVEVDLERGGEPLRLRVVWVGLPEPGGGELGRLVLLDDVTDLMRSNQLAAWAEMARAIAHEIKNPLTPIQLSAEHLRRILADRGLLPSPPIEACLETVVKQVKALHEIAREFSAFAKLPALAPESIELAAFAREVLKPYRHAPPPGVEIVERYHSTAVVSIDPKVLGRAVVNLIENALQAMPAGGRLTVEVADEPAGGVALVVADSGHGLGAEVRRRLFEPYFSTKSSGTGLGLAIVRRAVEAHQGAIEAANGPEGGAVFRIRLPRRGD